MWRLLQVMRRIQSEESRTVSNNSRQIRRRSQGVLPSSSEEDFETDEPESEMDKIAADYQLVFALHRNKAKATRAPTTVNQIFGSEPSTY